MTQSFDIEGFLAHHRLPTGYAELAQHWFMPMIETLAKHQKGQAAPLLIGINGCQGSGKSTLADLMTTVLKSEHGLRCLAVSIDDFYLTRQQRQTLASTVHPLLATRGVPGTHDVSLARATLTALITNADQPVFVPRFNKASDDRVPAKQWLPAYPPLDVVILEGWCVGSEAVPTQALKTPVNDLEAEEDAEGRWRNYVNEQLKTTYPPLFALLQCWIMLKAPDFGCVYNWRLEQENKLRRQLQKAKSAADIKGLMDAKQIRHFISHYQRVTEQTLQSLPKRVHFLYELDETRRILRLTQPRSLQ